MQVTIDGRSIYDPVFGGVSWQDIALDIEDIQRIEVVRGPNAASFGSNSFAGVINIFTEHPAQQQGVELKHVLEPDKTGKTMVAMPVPLENSISGLPAAV